MGDDSTSKYSVIFHLFTELKTRVPIYHNYKLDRKHSQQFKALDGAWPSGFGDGPEIR